MKDLADCLHHRDFKALHAEVESQFKLFLENKLHHEAGLLSIKNLLKLFFLYDAVFFNHLLAKNGNISFALSRRLTRSAGITTFHRITGKIVIKFSIPLLVHAFKDKEGGHVVNGIHCSEAYEALMRVMEHELIHTVEFLLTGQSNCNQRKFKILVHRLFGHTETKHRIQRYEVREENRFSFQCGDQVSFSFKDKVFHGTIHRITHRATVMVPVPEGYYRDNNGNCFAKYYVPLDFLKPKED